MQNAAEEDKAWVYCQISKDNSESAEILRQSLAAVGFDHTASLTTEVLEKHNQLLRLMDNQNSRRPASNLELVGESNVPSSIPGTDKSVNCLGELLNHEGHIENS